LTSLFEENSLTQGHELLSLKTKDLGAAHSGDILVLACTVLIGFKGLDRQTDRQTDTSMIAKTRAKHYMLSRVKTGGQRLWKIKFY